MTSNSCTDFIKLASLAVAAVAEPAAAAEARPTIWQNHYQVVTSTWKGTTKINEFDLKTHREHLNTAKQLQDKILSRLP
jgi:hypothetical protein